MDSFKIRYGTKQKLVVKIILFCMTIFLIMMPSQARSDQCAKSLRWNGFVKVEDIYNFSGGIKKGSVFDGAGEIKGVYNTEIAKLWEGGQFTFGLLGFFQSHNQTFYTGAIQSPSNLSANNNEVKPYLSYQQKFNHMTTARAGILLKISPMGERSPFYKKIGYNYRGGCESIGAV
jgi:hypothetical protein